MDYLDDLQREALPVLPANMADGELCNDSKRLKAVYHCCKGLHLT